MKSVFLLLCVHGAVSHSSDCQADETTLLQSRSLNFRSGKAKESEVLVQSLRDIASSVTERSADDVNEALNAAGEAIARLEPGIRQEIQTLQQQIAHAAAAVEACHSEENTETRASLQYRVEQHAAAVSSCQDALARAVAEEDEACERARDCLCDEARVRREDREELCAARTETYEVAFCEHDTVCHIFHQCHASETEVYNTLRSDTEAALAVIQQEYIAVEQASCITDLIMAAMTPPRTPIPHADLIGCDNVDISGITITFPQLPEQPAACPESTFGDPQCDRCVPLLTDYALGNRVQAPAAPSLGVGSFSHIRAVHKSGRVTCSRGRNAGTPYAWQECCTNGYTGCTAAFELIHNGDLIIQQRSGNGCVQPETPTGDVVCNVPIRVSSGDNFVVTWAETRTQRTIGDNEVDLVVDVLGCN